MQECLFELCFYDTIEQPSKICTNKLGYSELSETAKIVRYSRENWQNEVSFWTKCKREFVITVIFITEFDCI